MKVICLGSSAASLTCAVQIKRLDPDARVTLVTAQSEKPNNTCFLADYVAGKRSKESVYLPIPENITITYNAEVIAVNAQLKKVSVRDGQEFFYDKLFIGTGLRARIPEMFVPELYKKVFPFKSLDDSVRFERQQVLGKKILVIGGGVTGVEASQALTMRGYRVTLLEKSSRLLPQADQEISQKIHELLVHNGVKILLNGHVERDIHEFDAVFLAAGGVPATDFIKGQVSLGNGFIKVNERQQTSSVDIYAGGDACVGRTLWPHAVRDGVVAAYCMASKDTKNIKAFKYKVVITIFGKNFVL